MKPIVLMYVLLITTALCAQDPTELVDSRPKNGLYLNFLGDGSALSVNYERLFFLRQDFIISGKLGLGFNEEFQMCLGGCNSVPEQFTTIPHHVTGNYGKGKHFFEFGFGATYASSIATRYYLVYPMIGYRLLPLMTNKLSFRIFGQIPFSGLESTSFIFSPIGLSLGVGL